MVMTAKIINNMPIIMATLSDASTPFLKANFLEIIVYKPNIQDPIEDNIRSNDKNNSRIARILTSCGSPAGGTAFEVQIPFTINAASFSCQVHPSCYTFPPL